MTHNAVSFVLAPSALVLCIKRPATAREATAAADRRGRMHSRAILLWVSFLVGTALVVRGVLQL